MTHFRTILFWIWDIWCNSKILESHQDNIYQTSGEIDKWQWMFDMSYQLKRIRDNSQPFCSNRDHKLAKLLDSLFLKCKQKWPKLQVKKCLTVIIVVSSTCSSFRIQRAIHYRGTLVCDSLIDLVHCTVLSLKTLSQCRFARTSHLL